MTQPISPADLAAMRARCEAATSGPWFIDHDGLAVDAAGTSELHQPDWIVPPDASDDISGRDQIQRNNEFIAHARTDLPLALDEIARLKQALDESDEALRQSVSVQSHYAGLLNMHDGGNRIVFDNAEQWVNRLRALHVANELRGDRP